MPYIDSLAGHTYTTTYVPLFLLAYSASSTRKDTKFLALFQQQPKATKPNEIIYFDYLFLSTDGNKHEPFKYSLVIKDSLSGYCL